MAGTIVYLTIAFLVCLGFVLLGIRQYRAKKPVTINTGKKPLREEELTSVAEWNRRHGRNFIILGCSMFLTLSGFAYVMEKLDGGVLPAVILLLVLFAEIGWVMLEHCAMKKTMIKSASV